MEKPRLRKGKTCPRPQSWQTLGLKGSSLSLPREPFSFPQLRARWGGWVWREHRAQPWPSWPTSGSDSRPSSFFMGSSHPGVLPAQGLMLGVFCPLQTAGSQAPPFPSSFSFKCQCFHETCPEHSIYWQTYPLPVSFLGHSAQLAGWLIRFN